MMFSRFARLRYRILRYAYHVSICSPAPIDSRSSQHIRTTQLNVQARHLRVVRLSVSSWSSHTVQDGFAQCKFLHLDTVTTTIVLHHVCVKLIEESQLCSHGTGTHRHYSFEAFAALKEVHLRLRPSAFPVPRHTNYNPGTNISPGAPVQW